MDEKRLPRFWSRSSFVWSPKCQTAYLNLCDGNSGVAALWLFRAVVRSLFTPGCLIASGPFRYHSGKFCLGGCGSVRSVSCFAVCDFVLGPVGLSVSVYGGLVRARFTFLSCDFDFRGCFFAVRLLCLRVWLLCGELL